MGLLGLLPVLIVERARSSVLVLELVGLAVTVVVGCARCCGCFRCYRCGGGVAIAVVVVLLSLWWWCLFSTTCSQSTSWLCQLQLSMILYT